MAILPIPTVPRRAIVDLIDPATQQLHVISGDWGREHIPLPRPFVGSPVAGFHSLPRQGTHLIILPEQGGYSAAAIPTQPPYNPLNTAATSQTPPRALNPDESFLLHPDGRVLVWPKSDGTTTIWSKDSLPAASTTVDAEGVWAFGAGLAALASLPLASTHGATGTLAWAEESITLATGATTTDGSASLLPADALILAVVARLTTAIAMAGTTWSLGDDTTATRFSAANSGITAGTTAVGLNQWQGGVTTNAAGPVQSSAANVRVTCSQAPGGGVMRVAVLALTVGAPTS